MNSEEFDYLLPDNLIAQYPADERTRARLLVLEREPQRYTHRRFYEIIDYFRSGDVLVLNDTRVIPARLFAYKESTGARIEVMLIEKIREGKPSATYRYNEYWKALLRPSRRVKSRDALRCKKAEGVYDTDFLISIPPEDAECTGTERKVLLSSSVPVPGKMHEYGTVPLPPYIKRPATEQDGKVYQTVFAEQEGAVAAPTAGLHFDAGLLAVLTQKGVEICVLTLHVGYGTFRPVADGDITQHRMHKERIVISEATARQIRVAKKEKRRVIACGTTTVRALESSAQRNGSVEATDTMTDIFIYPGFHFNVINGMITNFHLPKSTLLMLVCAWGGKDFILTAYAEAVRERYRFYSYGDAMLIV